jgi:hypothetical protein
LAQGLGGEGARKETSRARGLLRGGSTSIVTGSVT